MGMDPMIEEAEQLLIAQGCADECEAFALMAGLALRSKTSVALVAAEVVAGRLASS